MSQDFVGIYKSIFADPEQRMPVFLPSKKDNEFLEVLSKEISCTNKRHLSNAALDKFFSETAFPQKSHAIVLVLYAPGHKRILISRSSQKGALRFSNVFTRLLLHPRRVLLGCQDFRFQMDFMLAPPIPINLYEVGMTQSGDLHFEIGIDGLYFLGPDSKMQLFLPGDAYVRSIMGMGQLRSYLNKCHGEDYIRHAQFFRFRTESYLSGNETWLRLYRGYPLVNTLTKKKIENALNLAIDHIQMTQQFDGRFLYYYDPSKDSRRDHEHPKRDPDKNPYYNILRHAGGGLTCVHYEKYARQGKTIINIRRAIDYLVNETRFVEYSGREGAYIYSEKKSKLGGAGIALYLAAEYQLLTGDTRYLTWAHQLAWHLVNQITATGEFIYYNIYLDKVITEVDNQNYFSFYYPGEAIGGLAKYLHLIESDNRVFFFEKIRSAMEFLLVVRPTTRASEYTKVPSDSWLMMGIMELWDFSEMRDPRYSEFVFDDARKMIDKMYKVSDAPYPDYAGAFYYNFGDYPYADGARCEGLLGAYQLALKLENADMAKSLLPALRLAAWALMHLVNTEDAVYSVRNSKITIGGIRFKYTRQWFRIDTIQHVASFFAKLLPYYDAAENIYKDDYYQ
jgi:hypothetical protein